VLLDAREKAFFLGNCSPTAISQRERPAHEPIPLPDGGALRTLLDAGRYIDALPRGMLEREDWQTVMEVLLSAVEGREPVGTRRSDSGPAGEQTMKGAILALDQAKRQLTREWLVPRDEALDTGRDLAHLQIAPAAQFLCDIGGNILRPALSGVEADDADGVRILAVEQVLDDGHEVGCLDIGLAPGATEPATEIAHDQADVSILVSWHNRGRPICVTHNATPDA
jgi:hypothetical protein